MLYLIVVLVEKGDTNQATPLNFIVCRNAVLTEESIYEITYYGKERMPVTTLTPH